MVRQRKNAENQPWGFSLEGFYKSRFGWSAKAYEWGEVISGTPKHTKMSFRARFDRNFVKIAKNLVAKCWKWQKDLIFWGGGEVGLSDKMVRKMAK